MSDKEDDKKPLKGFANKDQRKNINTGGRKRGSKNKLPTNDEVRDEIMKGGLEAFNTIQKIMRNSDNEANKIKTSFKILDTVVNFISEENKLQVKMNKDGKETSYSVQDNAVEGKKTGTSGKSNVYSLLSTDFVEED